MRKLAHIAMACVMASGIALTSVSQAEARSGVGLGIAAGIIGLGVLGAAAAANAHEYGPPPGPRYYSRYDDGRCYYGRRQCGWTDRRCFENDYGDTVCRGGRYVCERPLICD